MHYIRKVHFNKNTHYFVFDNISNTFISPVFKTPEKVAKYALNNCTVLGSQKNTESDWLDEANNAKTEYNPNKEIQEEIKKRSRIF